MGDAVDQQPIEAGRRSLETALRGELIPLTRIGIPYSRREARKVRCLRRLRWVPFLHGDLRAQRRLLKQIDRPRPDLSSVEGLIRHQLHQSLDLKMHVAMLGWDVPMAPDQPPFPRFHLFRRSR